MENYTVRSTMKPPEVADNYNSQVSQRELVRTLKNRVQKICPNDQLKNERCKSTAIRKIKKTMRKISHNLAIYLTKLLEILNRPSDTRAQQHSCACYKQPKG